MNHPQHVLQLLASLPGGDAAALRSSPDKQQPQGLILGLIERHTSQIRILGALFNLAAPILRLPAEILMAILYQSRRSFADIRLAHVCQHWRALISAMPEFWASMLKHLNIAPDSRTTLPFADREGLLRLCLERSAPRTIRCRLSFTHDSQYRVFTPHLSRLTELSVTVWHQHAASRLAMVLHQGLPNLETLRFDQLAPIYDAPNYWAGLPPLATCSLPRLRQLDIPSDFLSAWSMVDRIEHLTLRGPLWNADDNYILNVVNHHPLASLKFDNVTIDHWSVRFTTGKLAPLARLVHIHDSPHAIARCLPGLTLPIDTGIELSFEQTTLDDVHLENAVNLSKALQVHVNGLSPIQRFYLGNTRARGRVRLRGYLDREGDTTLTRLDVGKWHGAKCAVMDVLYLLSTFRAATTLTVSLHCVQAADLHCEPTPYHHHNFTLELPHQLRRLELLHRTPLQTRLWFARRFLQGCGKDGRPPSEELTLCWVLHVERGYEAQAREELDALESLFMETPGNRLGMLELHGAMIKSGHVYTKVADVPTNRARCVEVCEPFVARNW